MKLNHGLHLAYCTNIHRGETWAETFDALQRHTLAVRERVAPGQPYAIGLRLSDQASRDLLDRKTLLEFQHWLDRHDCYVFTINGFPYGQFHGARVKEQVYAPDWTRRERVEYTNRLFDILAQLLPEGVEGSVSTVPGSFKEFITSEDQIKVMQANLWDCLEHVSARARFTGRRLHLGLEPEPLCFLETSTEMALFYQALRADRPKDDRLQEHLGVNYDTCHLAVEFEEPAQALFHLQQFGVRISKIHLSSALKVRPTPATCDALTAFADDTYFHQVIERDGTNPLKRYRDLDLALAEAPSTPDDSSSTREWRIHFHIPLHSPPTALFDNTTDHLLGVLDALQRDPTICSHLEMETYTWEVMPPELKQRDVVEQLTAEYDWTLARLRERGLA